MFSQTFKVQAKEVPLFIKVTYLKLVVGLYLKSWKDIRKYILVLRKTIRNGVEDNKKWCKNIYS